MHILQIPHLAIGILFCSRLGVTINLLNSSPSLLGYSQGQELLVLIYYSYLSFCLKPLLTAIHIVFCVTYLHAYLYQVELFQGAGCVFCLLEKAKQPWKFHSHQSVPVPPNLISTYYQAFEF